LEDIGPFNLREYNIFLDATIDPYSGTIQYREWDYYKLVKEGSCSRCTLNAELISFNAAYLELLTSLFSEEFAVCALAPKQTGITILEKWALSPERFNPNWNCGDPNVFNQGKKALSELAWLDGAWAPPLGKIAPEIPLGIAPVILTRTFEEWAYGFPSTLGGKVISGLEPDEVSVMRKYGERLQHPRYKQKYSYCAGLADSVVGTSGSGAASGSGTASEQQLGRLPKKHLCFQVPGIFFAFHEADE
jgi:hypothetical protein